MTENKIKKNKKQKKLKAQSVSAVEKAEVKPKKENEAPQTKSPTKQAIPEQKKLKVSKKKKTPQIPKETKADKKKDAFKKETKPASSESAELSEAELKKIEKKKAKKLAQKLKKQQKKKGGAGTVAAAVTSGTGAAVSSNTNTAQKENAAKTDNKEKKKKQKKNKKDTTKTEAPAKPKADTAVIATTTDKVLSKKQKKLEKRLAIKEARQAAIRDPNLEAATVFVGNLPNNTKRIQIVKLFEKYAPVEGIRIRTDGGKVIHKHKARKASASLNAYVILKSAEKAKASLALNGTLFKENHLRVTFSTKKPQDSEDTGEEAKRTVFVGNLKFTATEESLREIFISCGEIEYVRCIRDGDKGCKGVAYVCFKSADAVGLALELNETLLEDRPIHVERYSVKKLGAKAERDKLAENNKKPTKKNVVAAKGNKFNKKDGKPVKPQKSKTNGENAEDHKTKKAGFRGVKVEALKAKLKNKKKKKPQNEMVRLASKIAPKK